MDASVLYLFIPTFFVVSITPGMCMTLALTMGMTIGVRKTFYMMAGELAGVALVSMAAVFGVAAVMLRFPALFTVLKTVGGIYLICLGLRRVFSGNGLTLQSDGAGHFDIRPVNLMIQGFVTAIANPKGWAFMISLLPPFIRYEAALLPQMTVLLTIILVTEFFCLVLYSNGGRTLRKLLEKKGRVKILNGLSGGMLIAVGVWLGLG